MTTKLTAYEQQEHLIIADLVHEQATVLDLGCGNGELLELLRERKDVNGQGIEIDDEAIYRCVQKGLSVGGAQLSEKHAGFVINRGGATFDDVLRLIETVQERVWKVTGILLEPEVKMIL